MYHSKSVTSNQPGLHERLDELVLKHIRNDYEKPYQKHNLLAFDCFLKKLEENHYSELILDSGCGTAMSSRILAMANPESLVVGIDQSYKRLNKHTEEPLPDNCLLLRANCEDFWRLCVTQKVYFSTHYILYPNPWPKSNHLMRRWHGHPVFPELNLLARQTILRSNWKLYLEEFRQAWFLLTRDISPVEQIIVDKPLTLFEHKYAQSGQKIYQFKTSVT